MMMRMRQVAMAVFSCAVLLLPCTACASGPSGPLVTCEVLAQRSEYVNRPIMLTGILVTDYNHYAGITGSDCPQDYLSFGRESSARVGRQELWDATQLARQTGGAVHLTAYGRIQPRADLSGRFLFEVEEVTNITVEPH